MVSSQTSSLYCSSGPAKFRASWTKYMSRVLVTTHLATFIFCLSACGGGGIQSRGSEMLSSETPSHPLNSPSPFRNEFLQGQGIDLIIIYGQSNAAGWGDPHNENKEYTSPRNVKTIKIENVDGSDGFAYRSLENPSDIYQKGGYSAWTQFSYHLESVSHRQIIIVNGAYPALPIKSLLPAPLGGDFAAYETVILGAKDAINYAGPSSVNSVSFLWLQGETDIAQASSTDVSGINSVFADYFVQLARLFNSVRSDLSIPEIYFFVIRLGASDRESIDRDLMNDLGYWQIRFCEESRLCQPLSVLPTTFGKQEGTLSLDGIHFTPYGYDLMGDDIARNYLGFLRGEEIPRGLYIENEKYGPIKVKIAPF